MAAFSFAIVVGAVGLIGFAQPAAAQTAEMQAFVYGGPFTFPFTGGRPGNPWALAAFGGGVDVLKPNGAGASLEGGFIGAPGLWAMQLSASAMYEKRVHRSKVRPFVSGGLTLLGGAQAINFGGGANIRGDGRLAFRVDVRDYLEPAAGGAQALAFRLGVTFR